MPNRQSTSMQRPTDRLAKSHGRRVDSAQELAVAALQFFAADPDRIGAFLAESGMDPRELRAQVNDPMFLAGILDHLLGNEPLLLAFCAENGTDPEHVLPARDSMASAGGMAPVRES